MKHLLLLLIALISFSANAQEKFVTANFTVMQKTAQTETLYNPETSIIYEIDSAPERKKLNEYFFMLEVAKGQNTRVKQAVVVYYHLSEDQTRRNINDAILLYKKVNK